MGCSVFCFNDTATTEIYTLSLHDALPISLAPRADPRISHPSLLAFEGIADRCSDASDGNRAAGGLLVYTRVPRSEEHTSELQSRQYLVCRLLLETKNSHNPS